MESRVSYAAAGVFVLLLGAAFVAMGLWLGADVTTEDFKRYSVYFEESVSGLSRNAPVKYRGVVVGRVERIELADGDPERVHLVVAVAENTPVKTDTRAKLDPQGVTGILHVELTGGTRESAPLEPGSGRPPYPEIASIPSFITQLDQAVTEGLDTLDRLAGQTARLLDEENLENFGRALANLEQLTAVLTASGERMDGVLTEAERMLAGGTEATRRLPALMDQLSESLDGFDEMTAAVGAAGEKVGTMAELGERELGEFSRSTLPEVNELIGRLQRLTDSLTRFGEELSADPRMLLFGRPTGSPGPGE